MEPLLKVSNLTKTFGTLPVIQQVGFDIHAGEIVGLTGSIGSGKSVLMMLLAGLYEPDAGSIEFNKRHLNWPFSARSVGIGVIHQKPTLDDRSDVVSNIFLGNELGWPSKFGWFKILNRDRMYHEAGRILTDLGVPASLLSENITNLSGEQRQMIAIAHVLTYPTSLILVDEPTVLLSYGYQQRLLGLIQTWREQGVAVLFSSNNLNHLFAITDRILILHQGTKVADLHTDETTREEVVSLLLGSVNPKKPAPAIWDFDTYERVREHAEKLRFSQSLLLKDQTGDATLNRQLNEQLAEQVQTLDQANLALIEAHRRLLSEREQERKHLARELHDQIIQDLLSINYELEGLETEQTISDVLSNDLSEVRLGIRELVDSLRRICGDLRPLTIDSLGLGAALQSFTRDWSARTGIKVKLNLDENLGRLPEMAELSIFRILQEGLNNVWRHAKATSVQVTLQHTSPRTLMVSLSDNGQGLNEDFDLEQLASQGHYGLVGISERVALLGGRFHLQRLPDQGSILLVEIPHPRVDVNSSDSN